MYKFRIKRWGLRKNWSDALAKQALRPLDDSSPAREIPASLLGTQPTHLRKLGRYLKRNADRLEPHGTNVQALFPGLFERSRVAPTGPRQLQPSKLRAPIQLELPDEMLRLLRTFLESMQHVVETPRPPEQDENSKFALQEICSYDWFTSERPITLERPQAS